MLLVAVLCLGTGAALALASGPALAQNAAREGEAAEPDADAKKPQEPERLEDAKEHYQRGRDLFDAEDLHGAVREFKQSFRLSKNVLLLYNLAFVFDNIGNRDLALFYYEKFLWAANPNQSLSEFVIERIRAL